MELSIRHWNYLQFSLFYQDLDLVSALLTGIGTLGIQEETFGPERIHLKVYFGPDQDINQIRENFKSQCQSANITLRHYSTGVEYEQDWIKKWRCDLKPFTIGKSFLVNPHPDTEIPDKTKRLLICLEPRMAFGTGTHPTTQLCLKVLEKINLKKKLILDVGTGSGILSIASIKLGAESVIACDIDPGTIDIAKVNFSRNNVQNKVKLISGDLTTVPKNQFDIVVANLDIQVLKESLSLFISYLRPSALLLLSGILKADADYFITIAKQKSFQTLKCYKKGDWCLLLLHQKNKNLQQSKILNSLYSKKSIS
ncbi:MAG: 50S ribosomal protein L11 methyltransferase [Acidobacteriia bacterium]|nr:50S ribosomal protein L11 methyltransferase [Terriglobia bacterium]